MRQFDDKILPICNLFSVSLLFCSNVLWRKIKGLYFFFYVILSITFLKKYFSSCEWPFHLCICKILHCINIFCHWPLFYILLILILFKAVLHSRIPWPNLFQISLLFGFLSHHSASFLVFYRESFHLINRINGRWYEY